MNILNLIDTERVTHSFDLAVLKFT